MAGTLKPEKAKIEGTWTVNSAVAPYGTGITNLFDGVRGVWNDGGTFYWNSTNAYIDITINQKSRIWTIGNVSYLAHNKPLKVEKWNGTSFELFTTTPTRTILNEWEVMIELDAGRYKFSVPTIYRMDDEWFIEKVVESKVLLKSENKTYRIEAKGYGEVLNKGGIASSNFGTTASNAFNGGDYASSVNNWWITPANSIPAWIQYKFPQPQSVDVVRIVSYYSTGYEAIKDFKILASNTGTFSGEEVVLFTGTHISETNTSFVDYKFTNANSYLYYRIAISTLHAGNGSNNTSIAQIQFRKEFKILTELPKVSMSNFLKYGNFSDDVQLNTILLNKNYILQDSASENVEGLWTTQINRKPLSIKFN